MTEPKRAHEIEQEFERTNEEWKQEITEAFRQKAHLVADLLTIKVNNLRPWYETKRAISGGVATETLYSRYIKPGEILVLTHISAGASTTVTTTTEIAIKRGGETVTLNRDVPSAADITVDWDGQVILIEGDRVMVHFHGSTTNDVQTVSMSGYKIKA